MNPNHDLNDSNWYLVSFLLPTHNALQLSTNALHGRAIHIRYVSSGCFLLRVGTWKLLMKTQTIAKHLTGCGILGSQNNLWECNGPIIEIVIISITHTEPRQVGVPMSSQNFYNPNSASQRRPLYHNTVTVIPKCLGTTPKLLTFKYYCKLYNIV